MCVWCIHANRTEGFVGNVPPWLVKSCLSLGGLAGKSVRHFRKAVLGSSVESLEQYSTTRVSESFTKILGHARSFDCVGVFSTDRVLANITESVWWCSSYHGGHRHVQLHGKMEHGRHSCRACFECEEARDERSDKVYYMYAAGQGKPSRALL